MMDMDIKRLEKAHPITQVALELGIKVKGSVGECFRRQSHPDETDDHSLFFNVAQNTFFCKSCSDVGGSVIDLVRQHQGIGPEEAVAWLVHRREFDEMTKILYMGKGKKKF